MKGEYIYSKDLISELKKIEKKALKPKTYTGVFRIDQSIDFSPKEYMDYTYEDIINLYEKVSKIINTEQSMRRFSTTPTTQKEKPSFIKSNVIKPEPTIPSLSPSTIQTQKQSKKLIRFQK